MPLFETRDGSYVPTELTIGPWGRELMHGGAVAALATTLLEDAGGDGHRSVRLCCDLVRPLVLDAMTVDVRRIREGRRLQVLEANLHRGDDLVARCSLTRISTTDVTLPAGAAPTDEPPPDAPDDFSGVAPIEPPSFLDSAMEIRTPDPQRFMGAPAGWFRLKVPVIGDASISPMTRLAATSDFGNGISALIPSFEQRMDLSFPNANVDVHLDRPPEGDWVRMASRSVWRPDGVGLTRSELADGRGVLGTALQSLVLGS